MHGQAHPPPNFAVPINSNPVVGPPPFGYPPFLPEGGLPFYGSHYEIARPDSAPEVGAEQGSLLGFSPGPAVGTNFSDGFQWPWIMGPAGQGMVDGFQVRPMFFQWDYGQNMGVLASNMVPPSSTNKVVEPVPGGSGVDPRDGKGILAPQPLPFPTQPPPPGGSASGPPPPMAKNPPAGPGSGSASGFKTKLCEKFAKGTCTFGDRCHYAHGTDELLFFGGGQMEEEEKIVKGDDDVELDATLEDLYMGGSLKVCEQCPNVKYERERYFFVTVDGQVQALVGYEETIKHLDEHLVDISTKVSTVCSPMLQLFADALLFSLLRESLSPKKSENLKMKGCHCTIAHGKGDLYVTFEILFPTSLTEDQKMKIKAILERKRGISSMKLLQIRLRSVQSIEEASGGKWILFTVAYPDHIILAHLPVAKGLGSATATSLVKTFSHRSRLQFGERVHFCICYCYIWTLGFVLVSNLCCILFFSFSFFGGGQMEEEEKIVKGDDDVELDATLEGLYMGGSLKVCKQCPNVKYGREGYFFVAVDGQARFRRLYSDSRYLTSLHRIVDACTIAGVLAHTLKEFHLLDSMEFHDLNSVFLRVQALVGYEETIKHLDEHLVDISTKGVTKPKEVRKFKGEGMPLHYSTRKG
ncbi:hypothetical protein RHSIM_Rhsim01G0256700 [Rhododendron simsii]|uniref:C3H1-type domain-containing protein n=1 Tax=Rhododendron simsii TaxID=118357 RepID=A0A834HEF7_RHOSS|nr:hypothetical protein RHSIM_Rhsim01G0256700 [Rhododendron simsii]